MDILDPGPELYKRYYPISRKTTMTHTESQCLLKLIDYYIKEIYIWTRLYYFQTTIIYKFSNKRINHTVLYGDVEIGNAILEKYKDEDLSFEKLPGAELDLINLVMRWMAGKWHLSMKFIRNRMIRNRYIER